LGNDQRVLQSLCKVFAKVPRKYQEWAVSLFPKITPFLFLLWYQISAWCCMKANQKLAMSLIQTQCHDARHQQQKHTYPWQMYMHACM
jgi:hypothetical protein